jgi:hypothetical protein
LVACRGRETLGGAEVGAVLLLGGAVGVGLVLVGGAGAVAPAALVAREGEVGVPLPSPNSGVVAFSTRMALA